MKQMFRGLLVATCLFGGASISQAGMIVNGSFEDLGSGSLTNGSGANKWGLFASIPGWSAIGARPIEIGTASTYGVTGQDGQNVLELDSTGNAVVSQIVASPGGVYTLNFLAARRNGVAAASTTFKVYWNGFVVGSFAPTSTVLSRYSINVTAQASNDLRFEGTGTNDSLGAIIDDVRVPDGGATAALLGMTLMGLGLLRRKR